MLRQLLDVGSNGRTRSEAESRLRDLLEQARLPKPALNMVVEGGERDFVWKRERLMVVWLPIEQFGPMRTESVAPMEQPLLM